MKGPPPRFERPRLAAAAVSFAALAALISLAAPGFAAGGAKGAAGGAPTAVGGAVAWAKTVSDGETG